MAEGGFVAYYRVSTKKQGASGLGLEAQREVVRQYLNGGRWTLHAEFTEVESGGKSDRVELQKALATARVFKAALVVAKLDRLSRSVAFLSSLKEQQRDVRIIFADMPDADELTVNLLASVAQHERKLISERTKGALAAAKRRGVQLGKAGGKNLTPKIRAKAQAAGRAAKTAKALARANDLRPMLDAIRARGVSTLHGIARELTELGVPRPRGTTPWSATQVRRVLAQLAR